ncbi:MAG: Dps family protein [Oligoflexales bacterium]
MKINIGINEADRIEIATGLSKLLADSYTLYLKTQSFHWNVTGPMFQPLHQMFENQYIDLATSVDTIAERIRALGVFAPASYQQFTQLSSVPDTSEVPHAREMIRLLVEGNETVARTARTVFPVASRVNDEGTVDLLTDRLAYHEKTAWMLRTLLEDEGVEVGKGTDISLSA